MSALLERLREDEAQFISAMDLIELIAQKNNIPKHEAARLLMRAINRGSDASRPEPFGLNHGDLSRLSGSNYFVRSRFDAILLNHTIESTWWEYEISF